MSHLSGAQLPHVAAGYHIGQRRSKAEEINQNHNTK